MIKVRETHYNIEDPENAQSRFVIIDSWEDYRKRGGLN